MAPRLGGGRSGPHRTSLDESDQERTGEHDLDRWIFAYGSLIWRPEFPFVERCAARLDGWSRRFWQASTDHRGTPERPGRVVTLVPDPRASCAGVAYRVSSAQLAAALAILDDRESGGYTRHQVPLALGEGLERRAKAAVAGWVYVAGCGNPNYTGPAALAEIARVIEAAHGPSGPNPEYVLRLADALRELRIEDPDVFALERLLRPAR